MLHALVPLCWNCSVLSTALRLFDERRDNAFGVLVRNLDQHHVARMALDKCCDIAVPRSADQVALPVAGPPDPEKPRCQGTAGEPGVAGQDQARSPEALHLRLPEPGFSRAGGWNERPDAMSRSCGCWVGSHLITRRSRTSAKTMAWRYARYVRASSNSAVRCVFSRQRASPSMAASSRP